MNSVKVGNFMKALRKEKGLTQEQLAQAFRVSRRTVSRWETGSNLPDMEILIEMADFYDVDLREILDGQRRDGKMNKELEETVRKVADYGKEERKKITRRMHFMFLVGLAAAVVSMTLLFLDRTDNFLGSFCQGVTFGMMIVGAVMTSRSADKLRAVKQRLLCRLRKAAP